MSQSVLAARKDKRGQRTTTESERVRSERKRTVEGGVGVGVDEHILGLELLEGERVGVPHVLGILVHEEAHRAL